jgi:hypothetical protein
VDKWSVNTSYSIFLVEGKKGMKQERKRKRGKPKKVRIDRAVSNSAFFIIHLKWANSIE